MCVRLEGDGPMVEEFEMSLWLAAGRDIWRGTALVTTAQFAGDFFWLLFQFVVVKCSVVCVVCVVVMFASMHYVQYFLYDAAVLLSFISKKRPVANQGIVISPVLALSSIQVPTVPSWYALFICLCQLDDMLLVGCWSFATLRLGGC